MQSQVWLITAASGGLGLALAKHLLEKGDRVVGTSRNLGKLESVLGKESSRFLPLELDFSGNLDGKMQEIINRVYQKFSRLDNLVNNAGYGLLGFVEETSEEELRKQFEVNVFAPFILTKAALKRMRPSSVQEGGNADSIKARIYNISSVGGFRVSQFSTPYCMSKFALSAFSEGLRDDLSEFGISVINVMPTGFRTEFLGDSVNFGSEDLDAYRAKKEELVKLWKQYSGKQPGNPDGFARAMFHTSRLDKPPLSLFMGEGAYVSAEQKMQWVQKDMQSTRDFAGSVIDFND